MMEYVVLKDVCSINMGQSPDSSSYNEKSDGLPFFQGNADFGDKYPIARKWCSAPSKIAQADDILISVRAPIGAMNYAKETCCIGRGLAALTPYKEKAVPEYIFWLLKAKNAELNSKGTGSTFKAIGRNVLEETLVPDIGLENQIKCSETLEKVNAVVQTRRQQLQKLDELVKARFIELFGDPVSNPLGWEMVPLGKRCKIVTGNTPSRAEPENYGEFIEWIKSDNINTPFTFITKAQEYLSETGFKKCRFVEAGSLLMTCIAGSINCIGNVAVTDRRVAFNQQINAIVPEQDEVLYLYWLMLLSKPAIHSTINMALKGILSKGQLAELVFPFPPIELQEQFAAFAEQTDKSKAIIQVDICRVLLPLDSVVQQYFGKTITI